MRFMINGYTSGEATQPKLFAFQSQSQIKGGLCVKTYVVGTH